MKNDDKLDISIPNNWKTITCCRCECEMQYDPALHTPPTVYYNVIDDDEKKEIVVKSGLLCAFCQEDVEKESKNLN